jgi:hypothetical protein
MSPATDARTTSASSHNIPTSTNVDDVDYFDGGVLL